MNPVLNAMRDLSTAEIDDLYRLGDQPEEQTGGPLWAWFQEATRLLNAERHARSGILERPSDTNTLVTITAGLALQDANALVLSLGKATEAAEPDSPTWHYLMSLGLLVTSTPRAATDEDRPMLN